MGWSSVRVADVLADWRQQVTLPAAHSSRLVFALCLAFAAPFGTMFGREPFAFHLWGPQGTGRAVTLWLAAAVYGTSQDGSVNPDDLCAWELFARDPATIAAETRDGPLLLCRFEDASTHDRAAAAMRVWGRSAVQTPRPLTLSEGEEPFDRSAALRLASGGPLFINLPADAGQGFGVFETEPELQVMRIAAMAMGFRGLPGTAWMSAVNELATQLDARVEAGEIPSRAAWLDRYGLGKPTPLLPFEMLALAGEHATSKGLTGWPDGHARACIMRCAEAALL